MFVSTFRKLVLLGLPYELRKNGPLNFEVLTSRQCQTVIAMPSGKHVAQNKSQFVVHWKLYS